MGKALRGAVQGLQAANTSPRPQHRPRWSLDTGKMITEKSTDMIARLQAFEERNKSLARLLESSVGELWIQQKEVHQKDEAAADALSLSIAKVQFVQVYLENSAMPLPTENASRDGVEANQTLRVSAEISPQTDGATESRVSMNNNIKPSAQPSPDPATVSSKPLPSTPDIGSPSKASSPSHSSQSRPTLSQSPFSWMLGDEQPKSSFVSASPFQSDSRDLRGKSNLFGETGGESNRNRKGSNAKMNGETSGDDEDVFSMGTLRGGREK